MTSTIPAPPLQYRFRVFATHPRLGRVQVISEAFRAERSALTSGGHLVSYLENKDWLDVRVITEVCE